MKITNSLLKALVLGIGKILERNFVTRSSHEVIDPGDKEFSHAFALFFKEKRNNYKQTK